MVARVTGEGLMVDQNEIAVVWVTGEAQAKADYRLGQLLGWLPELPEGSAFCPFVCPHSRGLVGRTRERKDAEEGSSEGGIIFLGQSPQANVSLP